MLGNKRNKAQVRHTEQVKSISLSFLRSRQTAYLQSDVTELPNLVEVPERVVKVLPSFMSLKDKRTIGLTFCFRCPASWPLLLGLVLLGMLWHHIPWCHGGLQETTPTRQVRERENRNLNTQDPVGVKTSIS